MMNARAQAYAREGQDIDASQSRAIAARNEEQSRPRNALEAMAVRLQVSPAGLKDTLLQTVFSACRTDAEFIALTIVANAYDLNPLTKEIYAFPKKGGGIQPMISYDGWIKIMNTHPQTDGFEFNHTLNEKGDAIAVEGVFYRKDRSRPTKKMVYLKEFKKNTEPWNNSPNHMLDVRCLCHTVRIALGINAGVEGDDDVIDGGVISAQSLPSRQTLAEELGDEIPAFDKQTGEVRDEAPRDQRGMTEVDEETDRALDAGGAGHDDEADQSGDEQQPEQGQDDDPAWLKAVTGIRGSVAAAKTTKAITNIENDWLNRVRNGVPDDSIVREVETAILTKKNQLKQAGV